MAKMRMFARYSFITLMVITVSLWVRVFDTTTSSDHLKVAFLSIGQGDAIYIEAPNGRQMIIDGGPKGSLVKELKKQLPEGDTSIDVIVVTNPDADHYAGFLELLDTYSVGAFIEPGVSSKTATYQTFKKRIQEKGIRTVTARKDVVVTLDQDRNISFRVLFPDRPVQSMSSNDASTMGTLDYGTSRILFTGDATTTTEQFLIRGNKPELLQSSLLKVGHHGSRTSTSDALLAAVGPEYAVISAGKSNKYGHPHQEIVNKLKKAGIQVLVTKDIGTIVFESDGVDWTLVAK